MDLHVDLNDEEVEYLQSIGLTDNIEEALTEVEEYLLCPWCMCRIN